MLLMINKIFSLFVISTIFFSSIFSLAEIHSTKIRPPLPHNINGSSSSLVFIEDFGFTDTGFVELNLSHISISNPKHLNLSQIGFFLVSKSIFSRINFGKEANITFCLPIESCPNKVLYTLDKLELALNGQKDDINNNYVNVKLSNLNPNKEFGLIFKNSQSDQQVHVSMDVVSAMYNLHGKGGEGDGAAHRRRYLSSGKYRLFKMNFVFIILYMLLTAAWISVLLLKKITKSNGVFPIHYVILVVLLFQLSSLSIADLSLYNTNNVGYSDHGLSLLPHLLEGVPLFTLVGLIGCGWSYLKHELRLREKILLVIVISVRLVANILKVYTFQQIYQIIDYPCDMSCIYYVTSYSAIELFSLLALLFHFIWTGRHLLNSGRTEGQSRLNLMKLNFVRPLFNAVLFYSCTKPLIGGIEAFKFLVATNAWPSFVVQEVETFVLYMFLVYRFWPEVHTEICMINQDEEMCIPMREMVLL
ncbi:hypothetical protein AQUCO_06000036v1 [Aquilegia coerulea]|uniref:CAND6/7 N-terminal domain-containing protein n=1 Tax=Aquilegia coerulea TaxID=218851 RepID=A0A2G5CDM2_AQUCA|nr:hypothetical protein AQUCO_06000036v1 [Aquilegia coerulea]